MKKLKNKIIATSVVAIIMTAFNVNISNAVLESRPDSASLVNKSASDFFALIRQMETANGPLGLNAIVSDDGTETSSSNNIDVHMIKNTEYGTVGMLAASVYGARNGNGYAGNPNTTTGNATGVYQMGGNQPESKSEYVAGILGDSSSTYIKNIKNSPQKYWNNYTLEQIPKTGDGTLEISWSFNSWLTAQRPIFSCGRHTSWGVVFDSFGSYGNKNEESNISSRAVVVSGTGL